MKKTLILSDPAKYNCMRLSISIQMQEADDRNIAIERLLAPCLSAERLVTQTGVMSLYINQP